MSQEFSIEQALAICTNKLSQRKSVQKTSYVLYVTNDVKAKPIRITGTTVKSLIKFFRDNHATYQFAFITRINDNQVLRFYNSAMGKKFYSMTRKPKAKTA